MQTLLVIAAIIILGAGAAVAAGWFGGMPADPGRDAYAPPLPDGRVRAGDLEGMRFDVALRGYDMAQVDAVIARLARELDERDGRAPRPDPAADEASDDDAPDAGPEVDDEPEIVAVAVPRRRGAGDARARAAAWRGRDTSDPAEAEAWRPGGRTRPDDGE